MRERDRVFAPKLLARLAVGEFAGPWLADETDGVRGCVGTEIT